MHVTTRSYVVDQQSHTFVTSHQLTAVTRHCPGDDVTTVTFYRLVGNTAVIVPNRARGLHCNIDGVEQYTPGAPV